MKNTPSLFRRFATLLLWLFMAVGLASAGLWWSMNPERGARWAQRVIDERFPDVARISPQELNARLRTPPHGGTPPLLIDVRTPEEQEVSTLRGARRVEPDATAGTVLEGVDAEQPVVLYCTGGFRAAEMAQRLMQDTLGGSTYATLQARAAMVRNIDAWYEAFDVKPGEKLYLKPDDRLTLW